MNLFFFVFIINLYTKFSLEGELIPCETSNPIHISQANKLDNINFLLNPIEDYNYNTFSYIPDEKTGNFFVQNEDLYYDRRTICKLDKFGQIIMNQTIITTTAFYGGENIIFDSNEKKYILSFNNFQANLIDVDTLTVYSIPKNYTEEINSYRNVLIRINKVNSDNSYLFGFISESEFLLYYYTFKNVSILNPDFKIQSFKTIPFLKIVSCFQTRKNYIECLYINYRYQTEVIIFNENFDLLENIVINDVLQEIENNYFSKAILYKDEIGIYLYCYNYLEIKELIYDKYYGKYILNNYIPSITNSSINIVNHNKYVNQIDLIRLAGNNFALLEMDEINIDIIYITLFTLYNNDRYLKARIWDINLNYIGVKFNDILRGFNFNNLIGFGFSVQNISSSCFIIFGYCNSTVGNIYNINADFELKPSNYFNINNNIFLDILYGYKIISIPKDTNGIYIASKLTQNKIFENDVLPIDDSIIFGFSKGNIPQIQFTIELVGITSQNPDLGLIENTIVYSKYYGKIDLNKYYKPEKFIGKLTKFNFRISNPINSFNCELEDCGSCLYSNPSKCLTCLSQYKKVAEDTNKCFDNIPGDNYYYDENRSMYMKCHSNCNKCIQGPIYKENTYDDLISTNCLECKNGFYEKEYNGYKNCIKNNCDKFFYIFDNQINCVDSNDKCPQDYPYLNKLTKECLYSCGNLGSNICIDTHKVKLTFEEYLGQIRNLIKNGTIYRILNESNTGNFIFEEDNITYHVTMAHNRVYNLSVSKVDLGICGDILKDIYDIDDEKDLLILKIDIKEPGILFPIVRYEVYHPDTKETLNLSYCQNCTMDVEYEVEIEEDELYIYDPNSDYYTDICNTTTSESGTDITLNDRKENFMHKNLSLCDNNCKFVGYNTETKQVKCECDILTEIKNNLGELKKMKLNDVFANLHDSLNFKVLVCHKLFFSYEGFVRNWGSYILLDIIALFIGIILYFSIKDIKNIKGIIDDILAYKRVKNFEKEEKLMTEMKDKNKDKKKGIKLFKKIINPKDNNNDKSYKSKNFSSDNMIKINNNLENNFNKKEKKNKNECKEIKIKRRNENKNLDLIQNSTLFTLVKKSKSPKFRKNKNDIGINERSKNVKFRKQSIYELKEVDKSHKKYKLLKLNDYELNILKYEFAIKKDERSFLEYYWALLKRNELFFFSFFPNIDYNSRSIKLFFFFHSFSFSYTINAVFFDDSTMHKIYEEKGQYYFVHRLPQKIITSLITILVDLIIRTLSLSERNIIRIKRESEMKRAIILSKKVYKVLKIKFSLFFILTFMLLLFFWYYLGCFCAVYKNTQIYLLKDTLVSYLLSLLYPFAIYFFIAAFRICSLKSEEKNKACLYNISKWLG